MNGQMGFRVVIFDLGGVLVKVEPKRFFHQLAQVSGKSVEEIEQTVSAPNLVELLELGQISATQFFERLKRHLGCPWEFDEFVTAWNSVLSENTQTTWMLQRLRARYTLVVLTNTNRLHDEHIRQRWPVFQHLHHWIASYQVGLRKPEPQIYQLALRQVNAAAHLVAYVDDLEENVVAARRLGLTAVHFTEGLELERELQAVGLHV